MTTALTVPAPSPTSSVRPGPVREGGAPLAALAGLEVRKSLSTRSGRLVALAAALVAPVAATIALLAGESGGPAQEPLAVLGMLGALVLLALGVLSTAGEWTHRTVQTTFLAVPRRGRVVTAKVLAMTMLGALLSALGMAAAAGLLSLGDGVVWTGVGRTVAVVVAGGAAFAVIGAGIGAAVGNAPAALTGTYLVVLGVFPVLLAVRPAVAEKLDPSTALVELATGSTAVTPVLVLAGWLVLSAAAGSVVTLRRAVA